MKNEKQKKLNETLFYLFHQNKMKKSISRHKIKNLNTNNFLNDSNSSSESDSKSNESGES